MKWTEIYEIAAELAETLPNTNPKNIRFIDLHNWIIALPNFDDFPDRGGEKVLEAIQQAWIEECE